MLECLFILFKLILAICNIFALRYNSRHTYFLLCIAAGQISTISLSFLQQVEQFIYNFMFYFPELLSPKS